MFDHLFENRNSTITHLLKLGDCLGRSLRENTELFSIDSGKKEVAFLTEGGKVILGTYDLEGDIILENIRVQDVDIFTDNQTFNSYVDDKVSSFVGSLQADGYQEAEGNFSDILSLWENRLKFENVRNRLNEKAEVFSVSQDIISTPEFQRFIEVMPQFIEFLSENADTIKQVNEVENAVKLSNSVSKAFNFPKIDYETLKEDGTYKISQGINKNIYELICKQELVAKELLESKKNFEEVWATNSKIRNLAGLIFENKEDEVFEALVEAIIDVPYLALATKKQLFESLDNALGLTEYTSLSSKKIKSFASTLFEMKKPMKSIIITLLNEKYGINIANLKEIASFKSLANTQVVIFESLHRLAPKSSVVKETLGNISQLLKSKDGVEVIDVNDFLQECFAACEYDSFCENYKLVESLSFDTILENEYTHKELLEKAKSATKKADDDKLILGKNEKGDDKGKPEVAPDKGKKKAEKDEKHPHSERGEEDDAEAELPKEVREEAVEVEQEAPPEAEQEAPPEAPPPPEKKRSYSKSQITNALKDVEGILGDSEEESEEED